MVFYEDMLEYFQIIKQTKRKEGSKSKA